MVTFTVRALALRLDLLNEAAQLRVEGRHGLAAATARAAHLVAIMGEQAATFTAGDCVVDPMRAPVAATSGVRLAAAVTNNDRAAAKMRAGVGEMR